MVPKNILWEPVLKKAPRLEKRIWKFYAHYVGCVDCVKRLVLREPPHKRKLVDMPSGKLPKWTLSMQRHIAEQDLGWYLLFLKGALGGP